MKSLYKFFFFFGVLLLLQSSCAQNAKKPDRMDTEYREKIKNIYKDVKSYDYNPILPAKSKHKFMHI